MNCNAAPIVLLHGWGFLPDIWSPVVNALRQRGVVAPILTPALPLSDNLSQVSAIESLFNSLPETAHLVGWSLGGELALAYTLYGRAWRPSLLAGMMGALASIGWLTAAALRPAVDVRTLGADFYVFSGHKVYGPTGIGVLWGRRQHLEEMPPWQGGGAMIDRVTFEKTTYAPAPSRFEAGTPMIIEVIGLHAAIDFIDSFGPEAIFAHESALAAQTREALRGINSVTLYGPEKSAGIVSFSMEGIHPHDLVTYVNEQGLALRGGHHCNQPLMRKLGLTSTTRASFYFYNTEQEIDVLVTSLRRIQKFFAG